MFAPANAAGHTAVRARSERTVLTRAFSRPQRNDSRRIPVRPHAGYSCDDRGGLVGGAELALSAMSRRERGVLTTQSSTKVRSGGAHDNVDATVCDGGLLAVVPDRIVCFRTR